MARVTVLGGTLADILLQLPKRFLQRKIVGESLVLPFGSKLESDGYVLEPGGSGANVAVGLQRLGLETKFITSISTDDLGEHLEKALQKNGLDIVADHYDAPTSLSVVLRVGADRTIITAHQNSYQYLHGKLPDTGWLHLGPLPTSQATFYQKFLSHIIKTDQKYSLNPSMATIDERERYFLAVLKSAAVLFVNYEEGVRLARLSGKPEPKEVLSALLRLGPVAVCLTCGSKGVYVGTTETILFAKALENDDPEHMDATGAGDAFASGFLGAYLSSELDGSPKLEHGLKYGIVNSAACVAEVGAQTGLLTEKQIKEDLDAVVVKSM